MASRLYGYFLNRWVNNTITIEQLEQAVIKGYITQDEFNTIINTPQYSTAAAPETV